MLVIRGFGITYRVLGRSDPRYFAIKEFMPRAIAQRAGDRHTVEPRSEGDREDFEWGIGRFELEAHTLARFHHPNIVRVLRYFAANGTAYMVMPFEQGVSLTQILSGDHRLLEDELVDLFAHILDGLDEVHKAGFLHRDIKPGNIYIRRSDHSPVLLDFGAARLAMVARTGKLTSIFSSGYSPYELYDTSSQQGPWTDVYAVGAVLYACITRKIPPEATARMSARITNAADPLRPAVKIGARHYSQEFLAGIDQALGLLETERPQSIGELRRLLGI